MDHTCKIRFKYNLFFTVYYYVNFYKLGTAGNTEEFYIDYCHQFSSSSFILSSSVPNSFNLKKEEI